MRLEAVLHRLANPPRSLVAGLTLGAVAVAALVWMVPGSGTPDRAIATRPSVPSPPPAAVAPDPGTPGAGHLASATPPAPRPGAATGPAPPLPDAPAQNGRPHPAAAGPAPPLPDAPAQDGRPHPNEPPGFEPFAEHDGSSVPRFPRSATGLRGEWWAYPQGNRNLTVTSDRDARGSPPAVLSTRFPRGQKGGVGPVSFGGWDERRGEPGAKSKVYLSMWLKIAGRDFENQSAGTKAGFLAVGRDDEGENEVFFWLDNGTGRQAVQPRFKVLVKQQGIPQPNGWVVRNMGQNLISQPLMTAGDWHHWEAVFELNTMGRADGRLRMWIDGKMVMRHDDVVYVTAKTPHRFHGFKWNPTWGGSGGLRSRDDFILIDHIYLSGLP